MLKAMIVEDNAMYRYAVKSILRWEDHGFEIIHEALNGKHALELLKESQVDLILTDISMPQLNGIELIQHVKLFDPNIKIVALSSYDDFHFVKEALKLGAEDYLLKHELEPQSLENLLEQMRTQILWDRQRNQDTSYMASSLTCLKTDLASKLLLGDLVNAKEIERRAAVTQFPILHEPTMILVAACSGDDVDIQAWKWSLEVNLVLHASTKRCLMVIPVTERKMAIVVSLYHEKSETDMGTSAMQIATELASSFRKANGTFAIGISSVGYGLIAFSTLYQQAEKALYQSIYESSKHLYRYPLSFSSNVNAIEGMAFLQQLAQAMKRGDLKGVETITEQFFQLLYKSQPEVMDLRKWLIDLFALLKFTLLEKNLHTDNMADWHAEVLRSIEELNPLGELRDLFLVQCKELLHKSDETGRFPRKEIQLALEYVHTHYAEDISVVKLAQVLNLSANYLSNLFKHETGQRIIEYINRYRIKRAKRLLSDPSCKVYEVAEKQDSKRPLIFAKYSKRLKAAP